MMYRSATAVVCRGNIHPNAWATASQARQQADRCCAPATLCWQGGNRAKEVQMTGLAACPAAIRHEI